MTSLSARGWLRIARRLGRSPLRAARTLARGSCPICETGTFFFSASGWQRDHHYCVRCWSIPRARAVLRVLGEQFPGWRDFDLHESSPHGPASEKMARECRSYVGTHWFAGVERGRLERGFRCEDLSAQTFADAAFDLVVTQDVFEHVLEPGPAFAEVARTLRPGGAHVFTVPWYYWKPTLARAHQEDGVVVHDQEPEYHGNPIDARGSLVVTEWGAELVDFVERSSGLRTTVEHLFDPGQGIVGEFREVFVSRKPGPDAR